MASEPLIPGSSNHDLDPPDERSLTSATRPASTSVSGERFHQPVSNRRSVSRSNPRNRSSGLRRRRQRRERSDTSFDSEDSDLRSPDTFFASRASRRGEYHRENSSSSSPSSSSSSSDVGSDGESTDEDTSSSSSSSDGEWEGWDMKRTTATWGQQLDGDYRGVRSLVLTERPRAVSWTEIWRDINRPYEVTRLLLQLIIIVVFFYIAVEASHGELAYQHTVEKGWVQQLRPESLGAKDYDLRSQVITPKQAYELVDRFVNVLSKTNSSVDHLVPVPMRVPLGQVELEVIRGVDDGPIYEIYGLTPDNLGPFEGGGSNPLIVLQWLRASAVRSLRLQFVTESTLFFGRRYCIRNDIRSEIKYDTGAQTLFAKVDVDTQLCRGQATSEVTSIIDSLTYIIAVVSIFSSIVHLYPLFPWFQLLIHRASEGRLCGVPSGVHQSSRSSDVFYRHITPWVPLGFLSGLMNVFMVAMSHRERHQFDAPIESSEIRLVFGLCCYMAWIMLLPTTSLFPYTYTVFQNTFTSAFPYLSRLLIGVLPVYVGYALFGMLVFHLSSLRFSTFGLATQNLFALMKGDYLLAMFNEIYLNHPFVSRIYLYTFCVFFLIMVVRIAMAVVAYFVLLHVPEIELPLDMNARKGKLFTPPQAKTIVVPIVEQDEPSDGNDDNNDDSKPDGPRGGGGGGGGSGGGNDNDKGKAEPSNSLSRNASLKGSRSVSIIADPSVSSSKSSRRASIALANVPQLVQLPSSLGPSRGSGTVTPGTTPFSTLGRRPYGASRVPGLASISSPPRDALAQDHLLDPINSPDGKQGTTQLALLTRNPSNDTTLSNTLSITSPTTGASSGGAQPPSPFPLDTMGTSSNNSTNPSRSHRDNQVVGPRTFTDSSLFHAINSATNNNPSGGGHSLLARQHSDFSGVSDPSRLPYHSSQQRTPKSPPITASPSTSSVAVEMPDSISRTPINVAGELIDLNRSRRPSIVNATPAVSYTPGTSLQHQQQHQHQQEDAVTRAHRRAQQKAAGFLRRPTNVVTPSPMVVAPPVEDDGLEDLDLFGDDGAGNPFVSPQTPGALPRSSHSSLTTTSLPLGLPSSLPLKRKSERKALRGRSLLRTWVWPDLSVDAALGYFPALSSIASCSSSSSSSSAQSLIPSSSDTKDDSTNANGSLTNMIGNNTLSSGVAAALFAARQSVSMNSSLPPPIPHPLTLLTPISSIQDIASSLLNGQFTASLGALWGAVQGDDSSAVRARSLFALADAYNAKALARLRLDTQPVIIQALVLHATLCLYYFSFYFSQKLARTLHKAKSRSRVQPLSLSLVDESVADHNPTGGLTVPTSFVDPATPRRVQFTGVTPTTPRAPITGISSSSSPPRTPSASPPNNRSGDVSSLGGSLETPTISRPLPSRTSGRVDSPALSDSPAPDMTPSMRLGRSTTPMGFAPDSPSLASGLPGERSSPPSSIIKHHPHTPFAAQYKWRGWKAHKYPCSSECLLCMSTFIYAQALTALCRRIEHRLSRGMSLTFNPSPSLTPALTNYPPHQGAAVPLTSPTPTVTTTTTQTSSLSASPSTPSTSTLESR